VHKRKKKSSETPSSRRPSLSLSLAVIIIMFRSILRRPAAFGFISATATVGTFSALAMHSNVASTAQGYPAAVFLCLDVDETVTGSAEALKVFNKVWCRYFCSNESVLVYNTARPLGPGKTGDGFVELVASKQYPIMTPNVIIVAEGTEIYWVDEATNTFKMDSCWDGIMSAGFDKSRAAEVLQDHDERIWKPENKDGMNSDDKHRFAITVSSESKAKAVCEEATLALGETYCVAVAKGWLKDMWLVTALPNAAGKDRAAEYVRKIVGFEESDKCMWAGDSDNDLPMLKTNMCGTVVGNAKSDRLRSAADAPSGSTDGPVFQANAHHAGGILEGMCHHGFLSPSDLTSLDVSVDEIFSEARGEEQTEIR